MLSVLCLLTVAWTKVKTAFVAWRTPTEPNYSRLSEEPEPLSQVMIGPPSDWTGTGDRAPLPGAPPTQDASKLEDCAPSTDPPTSEVEHDPRVAKAEKLLQRLEGLSLEKKHEILKEKGLIDVLDLYFHSPSLKKELQEIKLPAHSITWSLEDRLCFRITVDFNPSEVAIFKCYQRCKSTPMDLRHLIDDQYRLAKIHGFGYFSYVNRDISEQIHRLTEQLMTILDVKNQYFSITDSFKKLQHFSLWDHSKELKEFKIKAKEEWLDLYQFYKKFNGIKIDNFKFAGKIVNDTVFPIPVYGLKIRKIDLPMPAFLQYNHFDPLICEVLKLKVTTVTQEKVAGFLKFWKNGGFENLEFWSMETPGESQKDTLESVEPQKVLEGLNARPTELRHERASSPYLSSWYRRAGVDWDDNKAFDIQRTTDGRWGTVVFTPRGVHLLVWHPKFFDGFELV